MAYIAELTCALGIIDAPLRDLHLEALRSVRLPISIPSQYAHLEFPEFLSAMKIDKKSRGNRIRFVVLDGVGKTQRLEDPELDALLNAYEKISQ